MVINFFSSEFRNNLKIESDARRTKLQFYHPERLDWRMSLVLEQMQVSHNFPPLPTQQGRINPCPEPCHTEAGARNACMLLAERPQRERTAWPILKEGAIREAWTNGSETFSPFQIRVVEEDRDAKRVP